MVRLTALALVVLTTTAGCRTTSDGALREAPPKPDAALRRELRDALSSLDPVEGEAFLDYLARARAAFAADDRPRVRGIVSWLPDDAVFFRDGLAGFVAPVLLSSWARSRSTEARVEALRSLVRHPTFNAPDSETPGRSSAFDALEADLKARAEGLGLSFVDVDHVAYEIGFSDLEARPRARTVGVLVHADVVPADEPGWTAPPFEGIVTDDRVLGRGALDDKGPLVAALFAIAALHDSGVPLYRHPALVVGTSEETHWEGIDRLVKARGLPEALFVADGGFPAGIGEKGIATVRVRTQPFVAAASDPTARVRLVALSGGQVSNQVPATAEARLQPRSGAAADLAAQLLARASGRQGMALAVDVNEGAVRVRAEGKAAHSADPAAGHNAIADLVRFLVEDAALEQSPCQGLLALLDARVGLGTSGEGIGVPDAHPAFTPTTVNLGLLQQAEDGSCTATLNVRWPPPRTTEEVVRSIEASLKEAASAAPFGPLSVEVKGGGLDPFLIDEKSTLVSSLLSAYGAVTGEEARGVTLSGTTYAKAVPGGGVTFGPGEKDEGGERIHAPNEHITFEELARLVELYTFALADLGRVPR